MSGLRQTPPTTEGEEQDAYEAFVKARTTHALVQRAHNIGWESGFKRGTATYSWTWRALFSGMATLIGFAMGVFVGAATVIVLTAGALK